MIIDSQSALINAEMGQKKDTFFKKEYIDEASCRYAGNDLHSVTVQEISILTW